MTEIERLARKAWEIADGRGDPLALIPVVRAILQAMREPSEGMRDAILRATTDPFVERAWRAGIDHILSEEP